MGATGTDRTLKRDSPFHTQDRERPNKALGSPMQRRHKRRVPMPEALYRPVCAYQGDRLVEAVCGICTLAEARQLPASLWERRPGLTLRWGDKVLSPAAAESECV